MTARRIDLSESTYVVECDHEVAIVVTADPARALEELRAHYGRNVQVGTWIPHVVEDERWTAKITPPESAPTR